MSAALVRDVCGQEFDQRSRPERHLRTSNPRRTPTAADVVEARAGSTSPGTGTSSWTTLRGVPTKRCCPWHVAEVTRTLGEVRRHVEKPEHQPSQRGERAALASLSATRLAKILEGISFPATDQELQEHARDRADEEDMAILERMDGGPHEAMAKATRELGRRVG